MPIKVTKRSGPFLLNLITLGATIIAIILLRRVMASSYTSPSFLHSPWLLAVAVVSYLIQTGLTPIFAALALKSVGQPTRYKLQLLITVMATSANSAVPVPAGMPVRAFLQKKLLGIPYTKSASAIMIETAIGYGLTFLGAIVTSIIWFRPILGQQVILWQNSLVVLTIGLGILLIILATLGTYIRKRRLTQQVFDVVDLLQQASLLPLLGMIIIFFISFALALLRFYLVLLALGMQTAVGPLMGALLVSRIVSVLSFVPMGLGVRDISLASLLILIDIPATYAATAAAIDRLIITIPYLIGGVIATHVLGKKILVDE